MKKISLLALCMCLSITLILSACQPSQTKSTGIKILAVETFLADVTQNVAGDRVKVDSLIPIGVDPHAFEPTPQDIARIADSQVLIINGAGIEEWLQKTLDNAGGTRQVVEASAGLAFRTPGDNELPSDHPEGDPHFWLNPVNMIKYTENIRDALIKADPDGKDIYTKNTEQYIAKLKELDNWITGQVDTIPTERRLLVTNHESLGYFADQYGFTIVGSVIPSVSSSASPSAQQMASLIDKIKATNAPAIFLETGANSQLADQIAKETGAKVITDLYSHSISTKDGPAPTYIDMIKFNTQAIVDALK